MKTLISVIVYIILLIPNLLDNKMKYRIKIITFKSGRKEFIAQVKSGFMWYGISYDATDTGIGYGVCETRENALYRIDLHFKGNNRVQTIEFEYINK